MLRKALLASALVACLLGCKERSFVGTWDSGEAFRPLLAFRLTMRGDKSYTLLVNGGEGKLLTRFDGTYAMEGEAAILTIREVQTVGGEPAMAARASRTLASRAYSEPGRLTWGQNGMVVLVIDKNTEALLQQADGPAIAKDLTAQERDFAAKALVASKQLNEDWQSQRFTARERSADAKPTWFNTFSPPDASGAGQRIRRSDSEDTPVSNETGPVEIGADAQQESDPAPSGESSSADPPSSGDAEPATDPEPSPPQESEDPAPPGEEGGGPP